MRLMRISPLFSSLAFVALLATGASAQPGTWDDLARLTPGRTRTENALWIENALSARFNSLKGYISHILVKCPFSRGFWRPLGLNGYILKNKYGQEWLSAPF